MGESKRQQDRVEGEDKLRLWSLFKGSYYQTRGANESSCGDGSCSLRKREKGQRSAASMLTPLTHIPGSNVRRAAMEGTRNTKRDVEGSKPGAGALLLASYGKLQAPQSEPRVQPDACTRGLTKVVILNRKKEPETKGKNAC